MNTLSVVLFSGTDDRLTAGAAMIAGAAAAGRPVEVLVEFWALDAFRTDRVRKDHGVAAEAGAEGSATMRRYSEHGHPHWSDTLRLAKHIGDVRIHAGAQSMELLDLRRSELDDLVDDTVGSATFFSRTDDAVVLV